jgi:hypothetical protein
MAMKSVFADAMVMWERGKANWKEAKSVQPLELLSFLGFVHHPVF